MSILATALVDDHVRAWLERSRRARAEESARVAHFAAGIIIMRSILNGRTARGSVICGKVRGYMVILHDLDG